MGDIMTCKINADTSDGLKIVSDTSGVVEIQANGTKSNNISFTGRIVQTVNTQTGAVATGTTTMPQDDTIPQNSEGDEYMTLAITPTNSSNKLKIDVVWHGSNNNTGSNIMVVALFQDSTANALAAGSGGTHDAANDMQHIYFSHFMTAGTTSETTFKVRAGFNASGTTTFNGAASSRRLGGVFASSITIQEIEV